MSGKRKAAPTTSASSLKKAKGSATPRHQPTISQFFAPKPAPPAALSAASSSRRPASSTTSPQSSSSKENTSGIPVVALKTPPSLPVTPTPHVSPTETAATTPPPPFDVLDVMDVDSPPPLARRSRRGPLVISDDEDDVEHNAAIPLELPPPPTADKRAEPQPSKRTQQFKFDRRAFTTGPRPAPPTQPPSASTERDETRSRFLAKFTVQEVPGARIENEAGSEVEDESRDDVVGKPLAKIKRTTAASKKKSQYTPLEQQFLEIKAQNPDCLLLLEVGYKFRFFGQDAKDAAKELNIVAYMDHSMYTAGIPTHRLHVHVQKLVQLGYKVGVVRQMETAALKAAGDNKSAPFVRKLTNVYTKGTFVDDFETETGIIGEPRASYLVCINEELSTSGGDGAHFSIVAVQLQTGDVIFDEFDDNHMRVELETRLMHVPAAEIILPANPMSDVTEKFVKHLCEGAKGDTVRVERLKDSFVDHATARRALSDFYEKPLLDEGLRQEDGTILGAEVYSQALALPRRVIVCLAALLAYLQQFELQHVLRLTKFFTPFSSLAHMILNANALASLEVYQNSTDGTERGSLLWVLDHTKTRFGRRMMRKWIGRPLVEIGKLQERVDAVEEILLEDAKETPLIRRIKGLVCQLPDLERSITRIHYGRITPQELFNTLLALEKIATAVPADVSSRFLSPLLAALYSALPRSRAVVARFKERISEAAARKGDKIELFADTDAWPDIGEQKTNIVAVEDELQEHLRDVRKEVKRSTLAFVTVSQIEYLVEIPAAQAEKVPKDWIKISSTKQYSRFHTPFVIDRIKARDRYRERLVAACDAAYREFVKDIADKYELLRDTVQSVAILDCLFSLATVATQPGYCKPKFVEDVTIQVEEGRHPIVEGLVADYVANDINMTSEKRCLLITGPNMGGKSSYVRQVALIAIMGQIGSYVPARSATLGMFDSVHTRMGASDDLARGQSTFMRELQETSDIMRVATPRSLVILDELGRGTSTHDGTAIAHATLKHFVQNIRSLVLFVTHYPALGEVEREVGGGQVVRCCHLGFVEEGGDSQNVVFLYKLVDGLASRSYGLNVARLANLPEALLAVAERKAAKLESDMLARRINAKGTQDRGYEVLKQALAAGADADSLLAAVYAARSLIARTL
ncbi:Mismatch repair protein msh3 [Geranomyces variabilis]|uniref:DNA mismatch repair protein MSH3 n=1 Tax=Geranomyces variabilis TaxID=109894 RepID=A0AAD5TPY7_9FUNG|nr:Mismatch repair protein msh3 [Geranomyces variabilis]